MILSFADQATADIYNGLDTKAARKIPRSIWKVAQRKLDLIEAAHDLTDLRVPPGNKLEALKGDMAGQYSIRINDQFRIAFKWSNDATREVFITDYH